MNTILIAALLSATYLWHRRATSSLYRLMSDDCILRHKVWLDGVYSI